MLIKALAARLRSIFAAGLMLGAVSIASLPAQAMMLGSDQFGNLISIDITTGIGTFIGQEINFPLSTEIEYDNIAGILYSDEVNGNTNLHTINPATGLSTGFVTHGPAAFNGMEFVGGTLYVTNIMTSGGASTLETVNPLTGAQTVIGATGFGPISGLAYDVANAILYGVTAGGGLGNLVTINLGNGVATPGPVIFDSVTGTQLTHIGSIEFGLNGVLYGGMGLNANLNPGQLFSINTATGAATFLPGNTGLQGITGLTAVIPLPATLPFFLSALAGLGFMTRRSKQAV